MPLPQGRIGLEEFFDHPDPVPISRIELRRSTKTAEAIQSLAVCRWDATCLARDGWWFVLPKGTNKESGVRRLLDRTEPAPLIVAVGNDRNDLGILRSADVAVTVEGSMATSALPHALRIRRPSEGGWSELPRLLAKVLFT
jgi:hydroxymethylpyrimidine pyrophosphatase-like HAD family hydrolase